MFVSLPPQPPPLLLVELSVVFTESQAPGEEGFCGRSIRAFYWGGPLHSEEPGEHRALLHPACLRAQVPGQALGTIET